MRLILYTFAAYLGVDFLWELGESGLVPLLAGMQAAINVAACILICLIACWWALYAEMRLHRHLASMRGFQIVFVFPFAIMALLLVSSMVNNLSLASGDRLGSTWGDLYFIRFIVVVSYLALAAGHTLVAIPRAATSAKRGERLVILLFALALTFFAALDSLVPYLPFMSVGLMWTLIMVFVMLQRNGIFNDALTGLGNRRRMNEYLGKLLSGRREVGGHLLYMLDVNKFKRINDTYGHLEGDRALKVVALALRQTAKECGGFAARWGGDEFVLVVPATADVSSPDAVPAFANERLARLAAEQDLPFDVAVSAGYTVIEASDADPSDPIDRADRMLLDNKRSLYARD